MRIERDQFRPGFHGMGGYPYIVQGNHRAFLAQSRFYFPKYLRGLDADVEDPYAFAMKIFIFASLQ
jgi:hypothetical protein